MLKDRIYVLHSGSTIESLYTLFPLIVSQYSNHLTYIHVDAKEASTVSGKCVILIRVFKGNRTLATNEQKKREYITDIKRRFDRVIMLDDGAGSDSLHFEYMDLVDLYYKGKLLRDRSHYLRTMYGRQLFTDYYHTKYKIDDVLEKTREAPADPGILQKLRVSWNLGYGVYPIPGKNLVRLAKTASKIGFTKALRPWFMYSYKHMIESLNRPFEPLTKSNSVQARFGKNALPNTIGFQRSLFLQMCSNHESVLTGPVNPKMYKKEIKQVGSVLSLFGWGEVCFRDFETILNGGLLIKPDMSHLETWPDVYINSKTYVPVDWDGNNLVDTINAVSHDLASYTDIVESGKKAYRNALLVLDNRVLDFLIEAAGRNTVAEYYKSVGSEQPATWV